MTEGFTPEQAEEAKDLRIGHSMASNRVKRAGSDIEYTKKDVEHTEGLISDIEAEPSKYHHSHLEHARRSLRKQAVAVDDAKDALEGAKDGYHANINRAREHYEFDNADAYHAEAVKLAEADGKTINFQGEVARNVRPEAQQGQKAA